MAPEKTHRVFVGRRLPQEILNRLTEKFEVDLWDSDMPPDRESLIKHISKADGIFALLTDSIDKEVIDASPSLKIISNMAVGIDNIDIQAATYRGIPVGNTPGVLTETTADFAFSLLMASARRIVDADNYVRNGAWKTWGPSVLLGRDIFGATLGIIGYGAIGQAVAKRATGFNMNILYNKRNPIDPIEGITAAFAPVDQILAESDFVSLHVPLNEETRHLIGARELSLMKESATLINTARGPVVDQEALIQALESGKPGRAALDVTTVEPIDMNDRLLSLPNVIIAPHIASASVTTRLKMANMAVDNLIAGLSGERLINCANSKVYDT
jgi:glyoxylate reductase